MPPYAVLIIVLLSIGLCTLHLCFGVWIGQKRVQQRVKRTTKLASDVLRQAVQELTVQQTAARRINEQADNLVQTVSDPKMPVSPLVLAAIERLAGSSAALKDHLKCVQETFAARMQELQSAHQHKEERRTKSTKVFAETSTLGPQFQTSIESNPAKANARRPSTSERLESALLHQIALTTVPREPQAPQYRYPYEAVEYFAPFEGSLPSPESFAAVQCCDLSGDSISYFVEERPDYENIVISVGRSAHELFVVAKVDTVRAAVKYGAAGYVVLCQFIKRLDNHYRWDAATDTIVAAETAKYDPVLADLGA